MAIIGDRAARRRRQIAIVLVDDDEIGQLDDAFLDALQIVAAAGRDQQHEQIDHVRDRGLGLADPDRLDDDDVEAGGLGDQHGVARAARDAAQALAGGRRPDEGGVGLRQVRHARLVAEDRAARALRRGIDRQHRDAMPGADQHQAERLDEGRFADAGRAGNAEPRGATRARQKLRQQTLGGVAVVGAGRLHQRDGARQRGALAV